MDAEIWQQLLSLENTDITQSWYFKIHGRDLNARRAREINAAAKQSREYFRNASNANDSVRPLLTFYGVATLSRALVLVLKRDGGQEGLAPGHGLTTVEWPQQLSGDPSVGLRSLDRLSVQVRAGLFTDLLRGTKNRISIHSHSSSVDWRLNYALPQEGTVFSLGDLFARTPDLYKDYSTVRSDLRYAPVGEMTFTQHDGFRAKVQTEWVERIRCAYLELGYGIEGQGTTSVLTCATQTIEQHPPQFIHSYVHKMFGSIPSLYIAEPFRAGVALSQLCITFLTAYFLGMLVRYYPTHWISLIEGYRGDALWPTINRAQHFVEASYPELVVEMLHDILQERQKEETAGLNGPPPSGT